MRVVGMRLGQLGQGRHVHLRDHQDVRRRLRVDVAEGQRQVGLGDLVGRDSPAHDPAEQAVSSSSHGVISSVPCRCSHLSRRTTTSSRSCKPHRRACACLRHDHAIGARRHRERAPSRWRRAQRWDADEAVTQLYAAHYAVARPAGGAPRPAQRRGRGDRAGRLRRHARQVARTAATPTGARLSPPICGQPGSVGAAPPPCRRPSTSARPRLPGARGRAPSSTR